MNDNDNKGGRAPSPEILRMLSKANTDDIIEHEIIKLVNDMIRAKLIDPVNANDQIQEMREWSQEVLDSMSEMVSNAPKDSFSFLVSPRQWGEGSDISQANQERLKTSKPYPVDVEKQVIIDKPSAAKSIKDAFEEVNESKKQTKPISTTPYEIRGSIKDRKEEGDKKTTEEPAFITVIRKARELLDKYDDTLATAKVDMFRAKEAMLAEEMTYDGSRTHTDASKLHKLTKEYSKTRRELVIVEKVYNQALKSFENADVIQASEEALRKALEGFRAEQSLVNELDAVWGGKYRTGDDNFYKWLARRKKILSTEEAAELFNEIVSNLPEEVSNEMKRSGDALAPYRDS